MTTLRRVVTSCGDNGGWLLQCSRMADWRQIQARIRKAKSSSDPPAQLAEIYERTRDAMVAFELAVWQEKAGDNAEAARWYTTAAQRFRRAQWRTKAEEALTRLGAPIPAATSEAIAETTSAEPGEAASAATTTTAAAGDQATEVVIEISAELTEEQSMPSTATAPVTGGSSEGAQQKKKRRRGRRGGRGRQRGKGMPAATGGVANGGAPGPARSFSPAPTPASTPPVFAKTPMSLPERPARPEPELESHTATEQPHLAEPPAAERNYPPAPAPSWQSRTRTGEPALASRISQLESQVRRLLACPQASLEEADQAPAGPGVLLLSDSDQVTHYYIEACQTLRIGVGNLLRGGRGSEAVHLKERMAENLGIAESRVQKYLKDHCAVRWLQLDEGAKELAHFAIAVLRPTVNE
jgi:hypothetical protein